MLEGDTPLCTSRFRQWNKKHTSPNSLDFGHRSYRVGLSRPLECGGKRSATPFLIVGGAETRPQSVSCGMEPKAPSSLRSAGALQNALTRPSKMSKLQAAVYDRRNSITCESATLIERRYSEFFSDLLGVHEILKTTAKTHRTGAGRFGRTHTFSPPRVFPRLHSCVFSELTRCLGGDQDESST